jgi:hypothetical protein
MRITNTVFIALLTLGACDKGEPSTATPGATQKGDVQPDLPIEAGEPPPEEAALQRLYVNSVLEKLDGYKPEDAGNLAKVTEAFEKATPAMYVHVARDVDRSVYLPSPREIGGTDYGGAGGYWPAEEKWSSKAKGLLEFGGVPVGTHRRDGGNWIRIHRPEGYPPPLAKNTPGIVWEVDGSSIWFVSFDGGRYLLEGEDVAEGLPAPGAWPPPVQHALLTDEDVDFLGRTGALPKSSHERITAINNAFNKCVENGWKGFDAELDKLAATNLTGSTRAQRAELAAKKREEKVEKACAKHVAEMDAALVEIIAARNAEREALFQLVSRQAAGAGGKRTARR